ncbi:type III PLP-dependent enzyme [Sulfitobacter sp. KE29]|uniref:type III PLP-dependent enzyme n=1 Tax=Sulfitobacter TaxID=60136 RepID=UPI0007C2F044|nr:MULTISPECIES: type III PLP-dependent enzyme [Sulfitobacter]KZY49827.1 ornithine decarboxylase [Sulfitobacter sp. HI0054]MBO9439742.1 type III PLP-dependent enzyme [Sulfitobacter sp. R18_2]MDF3416763.1 type III PLP-dependent enzyme [Sulfitobacter sp. Ks38]MDF3424245.1 type III PLP-dependent enzyme [Sulfitobacter sp. KE29]MDF3427825.1 type III PLP-dependent enzyme [Sulfitobacter sp. S46]
MQHITPLSDTPTAYLAKHRPDAPALFLAPSVLQATARRFQADFDGLVTYAIKANDRAEVLSNLVAAGITTFDVASPAEMAAVRAVCPQAVLHYNNPVRSTSEVEAGIAARVYSWSVDDMSELAKLRDVPRDNEVAVRFALPVKGAAYDFGSKFGAVPEEAAVLLRAVVEMGFTPSMCFHPGTQCNDPQAWVQYVHAAADILRMAGVSIDRLNIGGGFAVDRGFDAPDHRAVFAAVKAALAESFGAGAPALLCEPGRAMVADAAVLATRIKGMRNDGRTVFLNDGIYGGLPDLRDMGLSGLVDVVGPDGMRRQGAAKPRVVFGPTCDSLDRLPDGLPLPEDAQTGDYLLFGGMGAYSIAMSTAFNGYGLAGVTLVSSLEGALTRKAA